MAADEARVSYVYAYSFVCVCPYGRRRRCPGGVVVKVLDCRIVESEFELQSRYYVHFRTNTIGKGMNNPYSPSNGLNSTTIVLL